jgi:hypothetical protein
MDAADALYAIDSLSWKWHLYPGSPDAVAPVNGELSTKLLLSTLSTVST